MPEKADIAAVGIDADATGSGPLHGIACVRQAARKADGPGAILSKRASRKSALQIRVATAFMNPAASLISAGTGPGSVAAPAARALSA